MLIRTGWIQSSSSQTRRAGSLHPASGRRISYDVPTLAEGEILIQYEIGKGFFVCWFAKGARYLFFNFISQKPTS